MFDPKPVQAWQSITPSDELKQRVLAQVAKPGKKVVAFPGKRWKSLAGSLAACLIFGLVLLQSGAPRITANGEDLRDALVLQAPATVSRQIALASVNPTVTILLEADDKTELTVSGGTLEHTENGTLWTVEAPGPHTLQAVKNGRTRSYLLTYDRSADLWTLTPEK